MTTQNTKWIVGIALVIIVLLVVFRVDLNLNSRFAVGVGNVDQSQTTYTNTLHISTTGHSAPNYNGYLVGQTFKPTVTTLSKIEINLYSTTPGNIILSVYDSPSKTTLWGSSTLINPSSGWQEFVFPTPISVIPGTSYYFEITTTSVDLNGQSIKYNIAGNYANGDTYYKSYTGTFSVSNYDLVFKTYYSSVCTESWTCGSWSACNSGTQTRTCTDSNNCGTTVSKPATSQSCTSTCNTPADIDCNNAVSNTELIAYGNRWISGSITRSNLASAIVAWINGPIINPFIITGNSCTGSLSCYLGGTNIKADVNSDTILESFDYSNGRLIPSGLTCANYGELLLGSTSEGYQIRASSSGTYISMCDGSYFNLYT